MSAVWCEKLKRLWVVSLPTGRFYLLRGCRPCLGMFVYRLPLSVDPFPPVDPELQPWAPRTIVEVFLCLDFGHFTAVFHLVLVFSSWFSCSLGVEGRLQAGFWRHSFGIRINLCVRGSFRLQLCLRRRHAGVRRCRCLLRAVLCSCSVAQPCLTLWPHGLQHARLPCASPTPRACSNSCPLSRWCHPTISSSVIPFSCLQSFPASGSFQMSQLFASGGQSIGASASVLPI